MHEAHTNTHTLYRGGGQCYLTKIITITVVISIVPYLTDTGAVCTLHCIAVVLNTTQS